MYTPAWEHLYLQVRREGESEWIDLPEREYFPAEPFGRVSRLNMLLFKEGRTYFPQTRDIRQFSAPRYQLSAWLARRYAVLHPDAPGVVAVRYLRARHLVGLHLNDPKGRWVTPPRAKIPERRIAVIAQDDRETPGRVESGAGR